MYTIELKERNGIKSNIKPPFPACILRLSKHYEQGSKKYGDRNWEKGIPISVMLDSGIRHTLKYLDGQNDEDHLIAALCCFLLFLKERSVNNVPYKKSE